MAAVTPTQLKILRVADLGQEEVVTLAYDASRQGKVAYVNTAGKAVAAQADTLAKSGGTSTKGTMIGIMSTKPKSELAEEPVTLLRDADVFLGVGVLDAYDIGAPIFLSAAAAGGLVDAAPATTNNTVIQIGHVIPIWREGGLDKALRINTLAYSIRSNIVVVG